MSATFTDFLRNMSRIGKWPVQIPSGVDVTVEGSTVTVKGPKGELASSFDPRITIKKEESEIVVTRNSDEKEEKALHGLTRSLIQNMVTGVTEGFEKRLEVIGVGYRAQASGSKLNLSLGFSHPVEMVADDGLKVEVDGETKHIVISGADKQKVGAFAAKVRSLRKPEPYKGKGVRYVGEHVRRKAGKTASK